MADDVELFIFAPAQLASQKSEFFEEVYFRRRTYMGAFNLASNMAAELSFQCLAILILNTSNTLNLHAIFK